MATASSQLLQTPSFRRRERAPGGSITARDVLNSLFYYRRVALTAAAIVIAIGVALALFMPPRYVAEARLLTLNAGYYDLRTDRPDGGQALAQNEVVNVELQLLSSAELHRAVVREMLGPGASEDQVASALGTFEGNLKLNTVQTANVIEVSYADRDPVRAADVLKLLLKVYFRERSGVLNSGRVAFLTRQRDQVKAQLDQASAQIAAYQAKNNVVDIAGQISGAVTLDGTLRQQKLDAQAELAQTSGSLGRLRQDARDTPRNIELYTDNTEAAQAVGSMQTTLLQLQAKRADLASRYLATSPFVTQVDQQIARLRQSIKERQGDLVMARRTGYNEYYTTVRDRLAQADATLASQRARSRELDRQLVQSTERLQQLNAVQDTLGRLKLQRDLLDANYRNFAGRVQQANIQQNETASGTSNVRVIEAPVPPSGRSNPPILFLAASVFAAILLAGAIVFVLSSVRETFLSPQEAERTLRVPVLSAPLEDGGLADADNGRLVAAIERSGGGTAKVTLVTAARADDGLDDAAHRLVRALSHRAPERVATVEIDADMPDTGGTMPAATLGNDGASARVAAWWINRSGGPFLDELRRTYSYVVLVAPPLNVSSEAVSLAPLVDATVLVIRAEETRKPVAEDLIARISNAGAEVTGLVMTGRRSYIPNAIYRRL